jgi:hypothetical protein
MKDKRQSFHGNENELVQGNNITLDELAQIEELAHRSHSYEADIILRLSAALREAMQIRANALALMSDLRGDEKAEKIKSEFVKLLRG